MGRPAKLTPEQLVQIEQRLLAGESAEKVAKDFGVSGAALRKRFGSQQTIGSQSSKVREAAEKLVVARTAIEALPIGHRSVARDLADSLMAISTSLARTAELSSRTAHRMASLANSQAAKVDDADPLADGSTSLNALKSVSTLTKMANEASVVGLNLLNANRDRMPPGGEDDTPSIDVTKLSNETLMELLSVARPR
jgi:hypothetical protein